MDRKWIALLSFRTSARNHVIICVTSSRVRRGGAAMSPSMRVVLVMLLLTAARGHAPPDVETELTDILWDYAGVMNLGMESDAKLYTLLRPRMSTLLASNREHVEHSSEPVRDIHFFVYCSHMDLVAASNGRALDLPCSKLDHQGSA